MYTYKYTHIYVCNYIHIPVRVCVPPHKRVCVCTCVCVRECMWSYISHLNSKQSQLSIQLRNRQCAPFCWLSYKFARVYTYVYVHIYTYVCICICMHIHIHIFVHSYTHRQLKTKTLTRSWGAVIYMQAHNIHIHVHLHICKGDRTVVYTFIRIYDKHVWCSYIWYIDKWYKQGAKLGQLAGIRSWNDLYTCVIRYACIWCIYIYDTIVGMGWLRSVESIKL